MLVYRRERLFSDGSAWQRESGESSERAARARVVRDFCDSNGQRRLRGLRGCSGSVLGQRGASLFSHRRRRYIRCHVMVEAESAPGGLFLLCDMADLPVAAVEEEGGVEEDGPPSKRAAGSPGPSSEGGAAQPLCPAPCAPPPSSYANEGWRCLLGCDQSKSEGCSRCGGAPCSLLLPLSLS